MDKDQDQDKAQAADDLEGRRFAVAFPDGWDAMTDAEKEAASLAMAREIQKQMGIEPTA